VDGAVHERALLFIEHAVGRHAVNLRGGGEDEPLSIAHAEAHDCEIRFEVQLEDAQGIEHVLRGIRDGDQWQHHVALLDVVLDPFLVDGDVAFHEVKARTRHEIHELVVARSMP
jgi:hypothetical protein